MTRVQTDAIKKLQDKEQKMGANSKYATAVYSAVRDAMVGQAAYSRMAAVVEEAKAEDLEEGKFLESMLASVVNMLKV